MKLCNKNIMSDYKKILVLFVLTFGFSQIFSQQKNKSKIDNYLKEEFAFSSDNFSLKNSIETNPNYDVYYIQQKFNGLEIHNAITTLSIKDESISYVKNNFIDYKLGKSSLNEPIISGYEAIQKTLNELNINSFKNSPDGHLHSNHHNIEAKLIYILNDDKLSLSWNFNFITPDNKNWYDVFADAESGKVLKLENWMINCEFDHKNGIHDHANHIISFDLNENKSTQDGSLYRVIPVPTPSPNHGPFELVSNPASIVASPFGWHDTNGEPGPEYTITRGNNVYAKEDDEGDGSLSGQDYSPDGGEELNFNFTADLSLQPADNMDASITNLFYVNNMMHDVWYRYGFDESSGNFQENNYGNGGNDGDSVFADGQDGDGFNNASFGTPPDGSNPQMTMYLWNGPATDALTLLDGNLAGSYLGVPAGFGNSLPNETPLVGELALLFDIPSITELEPDLNDGCQQITNPEELDGKIVVIRRGECEFGFKVLAAQNAGAIAVIMVNNVTGNPITMGAGAQGGNVTIPSIMISQSNGEALINELLGNEIINASLIDNSTYLDSDYDTEIIAHEYGHGISNRLMGGAQSSGCMQNLEQQGEGFSDWFGLMLTMREGDSPSLARGVATYSSGQDISGNGLRNAPYSPDFSVNDYTYADSNNTATVSQPHGVGFVFATMLWDLTWAFVDEYGFDPDITYGNGGNNKVMQLIIDGLKVAPCSSGFVDMRDAIILADQLTNNGINKCLIWEVFANRGLGYLAEQGDEDSRTDQVEDFSLPPSCESSSNNLDSGVLSINSPQSGVLTQNENISVSVRNFGVNSISNFDIYFQINNQNQITETINETMDPGDIIEFTFENTYDFSVMGEYTISVGTLLENDEDSSNDSVSINIVSQEVTVCPDDYSLPIVWRDNFECYDSFAIDNIGDWIIYDLDGGTTWGANAVDFENESYVGAGIIYNNSEATSSGSDIEEEPLWNTYEGEQGLYFVASGANQTTTPNDDWMISPEFSLDGIGSPIFSFKAKTLKDDYGLERFRIGVGNSTDYNNFTIISEGAYLEAPTEWTTYEFDLTEFDGQNIRIAINYVGNDSFVFQTDAFKVEGTLGLGQNEILNFEYFYNPINDILNLKSDEVLRNIKIFNSIGQLVLEQNINSTIYSTNLNMLSTSIYFIKVEGKNGIKSFKLRVR